MTLFEFNALLITLLHVFCCPSGSASGYNLFDENYQKFALEFIDYLTNGKSKVSLQPDSVLQGRVAGSKTLVCVDDGNAIAAFESEGSIGYLNTRMTGSSAKIQSIDGPGNGGFIDAHLSKAEFSLGRLVGVHLSSNVKTGLCIRNENAELHVFGFGEEFETDGLQFNTPLGGVNVG